MMKTKQTRIYQWLMTVAVAVTFTSLLCTSFSVFEESLLNGYIENMNFKPVLTVILEYPIVQTTGLFICTLLPSYVVAAERKILMVVTLTMLGIMIVLPFFNYDMSKISIAMILFLSFYQGIRLSQISDETNRKTKDVAARTMMVFGLVPILVLLILPQSTQPLQWKMVRAAWVAAQRTYSRVVNFAEESFLDLQFMMGMVPIEFEIGSAGYSGQGKVSGKVNDNDRTMLLISANKDEGNLYVTGSVSATYTGERWEKIEEGTVDVLKEYELDYAELMRATAISGLPKENARDVMRITEVQVMHTGIRTKSLFYPLKTLSIYAPKAQEYEINGANITYDKLYREAYGYYKSEYVNVDYSGEFFVNMLQNEEAYRYDSSTITLNEIMDSQVRVFGSSRKKEVLEQSMNLLPQRSVKIHENYLQLPEALPQRVYDLADEVTAGCNTEYEKMAAIDKFLEQYKYTKSPKEIKSKDLVDGFLFETQEGYCTYFSSAMAVMGRCVGVPTRYVEGFYNDYSEFYSRGTYKVQGVMGHAWCEYYVEGIGWIPMEATHGCGFSRHFAHISTSTFVPPVEKETSIDVPLPGTDTMSGIEKQQIEKQAKDVFIRTLLIILAIISICSVIGYLIMKAEQQRKYRRFTTEEKIRYLFGRSKSVIKSIYPVSSDVNWNLSATEWTDRLFEMLRECEKSIEEEEVRKGTIKAYVTKERVIDTYLRAAYSDSEITEEDVRIFELILRVLIARRRELNRSRIRTMKNPELGV